VRGQYSLVAVANLQDLQQQMLGFTGFQMLSLLGSSRLGVPTPLAGTPHLETLMSKRQQTVAGPSSAVLTLLQDCRRRPFCTAGVLSANTSHRCRSRMPVVLCAKLQSNAVQVNYINAHATSTLVGDIAEIKAVKSAFPDTKHLKVNGTKSMIGHCLGAAGGMEAIATLKAIETGWVHPTLNQVGASALCWPAAL